MEKHSSLSSAVWSLLSVQTWTLAKVRSCSNSSKEFCFPHTVLSKVFVEMRGVHLIKKQKEKPQEPNQQQQNSPFPLLWCGKLECPGPGGSHYLSLVFLPQGTWPGPDKFPHTWAFIITWEMLLSQGELHLAVLENPVTLDGAKSLRWILNLEELLLLFSFSPCSKTDVTMLPLCLILRNWVVEDNENYLGCLLQ